VAIDIGGTNARFAIADVDSGRVRSLGAPTVFHTHEHASLELAFAAFARTLGADVPRAAAIAVAGPVQGETLKLTNADWIIRPATLDAALGLDAHVLVNDFGAMAHAVMQVGEAYLAHLCGPDRPLPQDGVVTVIGPGTGLGVAHALRRDGRYFVMEGEGGHLDYAPLDAVEDRILVELRARFRRVSTERIASGPGLANIHSVLAAMEGEAIAARDDVTLWQAALKGEDRLARAALDRFCLAFGAIVGDVALAQGASAVVLAGGVGARIAGYLPGSGFHQRFTAKGRFERMMADMPVRLITHPYPGLYGAAAAFAMKHA
jgi:glucokinase